ncbi:MAG: galactose mutarotase [Chitinophagales bacterium]|nr:galactose mutarotase [Chitinophagales bacterium]
MQLSKISAGNFHDEKIFQFQLSNGWMKVDILSYGATIMSVEVPDRLGVRQNVVAGFHSTEKYMQPHPYLGCTIGRFANRIAGGKFAIDGRTYQLSVNEPPNHLHGGHYGFDKKAWHVINTIEEEDRIGVRFGYVSKNGEEGYPGTLQVTAAFTLTTANELHLQYTATTDKATIVNLTNHAYFNLSAFQSLTIHRHLLKLNAAFCLQRDKHQVPTGVLQALQDGALDFGTAKEIGEGLRLLRDENGIDHTFVIRNYNGSLIPAAELTENISGRKMKVLTDQPGIHIYTANFWNGQLRNDDEIPFEKHGAIALETGFFPDAPNHPNFAGTILKPGEVYRSTTVFKFLNAED